MQVPSNRFFNVCSMTYTASAFGQLWLQELKEASLLVLYSNLYETKFPLIIGVHKIGTICELVMLNVIIKGNIADISLELSERVFDE